MMGRNDVESPVSQEGPKAFDFSEKSIRQGFIKKVFSILMIQLLVTFGMVSLFITPTAKSFVKNHRSDFIAYFFLSIVLQFVVYIVLVCCPNVRRKTPMNFILLSIFTITEGLILGFISAWRQTEGVLMAIGVTAVICLALIVFAFQTKWDFTGMHTFAFIIIIALFFLLLFGICFPSRIMHIIIGVAGAMVFSFFLVYDVQLMIGGKHKYAISPEEYITAALELYVDITAIFRYILMLLADN